MHSIGGSTAIGTSRRLSTGATGCSTTTARRLLRLLSVFANGFTIEASRAVADADDPLATLTKLVNKSLVVWDPDASRYRILESIRTFARARLEEAGEADTAGARHLAWCASLAEELKSHSRTGGKHEALTSSTGSWTTSGSPSTGRRSTVSTETTQPVVQTVPSQAEAEGPAPPDWWLVAVPDREYYEQVETDDEARLSPRTRFPGGFDSRRIGRRSAGEARSGAQSPTSTSPPLRPTPASPTVTPC